VSVSYRSQAYPVRRAAPPSRSTAGWLAIIVFVFLAGIGIIGALAAVSVYAAMSTGLPPVSGLTDLRLPQETVLLDRTGETELARFGEFKREVVPFDEIPPILLDATTAVEDKTFWENAGFDPTAIVAAGIDSLRGNSRGASTITQQLVRARLLPPDLVQDPERTVERKLKEIIQSIRLTQAYSGDEGKRDIIAAYLNLNYYGNQSYGVKAAAKSYFSKALADLTPGEAALLAALPQSPSNYDLVRNAVRTCDVPLEDEEKCPDPKNEHLILEPDTKIAQRRDAVLELMADDRMPMSRGAVTDAQLEAEKGKPIELARQAAPRWHAPHFVWAVQTELARKICGPDTPTCDQLEEGGFRVTTTLDLKLQGFAENWIRGAVFAPKNDDPAAFAKRLGFDKYLPWMQNLENKNVRNGALVAIDYQTGEVIAHVGSANYYATSTRPQFQPQFDVVTQGYRQPGSAFKPFNYAVGLDDQAFTAGDMLMDVGTDFGGGYTPTDADNLERGPVRVRTALQFSLNIPAVKAMALNSPDHVYARAKDFGMTFQRETTDAGLALALGVAETRPIDLVTAYGTLANGGVRVERTSILKIVDAAGKDVPLPEPAQPVQVVSPQAAYIVTDILNGNTLSRVNPFWGKFVIRGPEKARRPATLKTGTNNDAKDLNAYGYIAPPTEEGRAAGAYALAVGVWNGNSDNTPVSTPARPVFSIDVSTFVWQGFMQQATAKWEITRFARPSEGLTQVAIDPFTGMLPARGTEGVDEWFIGDTAPTSSLPAEICGTAALETVGHERKFQNWLEADRDWLRRAARGPGTAGGPDRTRTAYFYNNSFQPYGRTWGPFVTRDGCGASPSPSPSCIPLPTPDASGVIPSFDIPSPSGSEVAALPCPPPSPSPSVEPTPTTEVTPAPPPEPTPTPEITPPPPPTEPPPVEPSIPAPAPS
jgi:peptidoglycan glycosyltransferase